MSENFDFEKWRCKYSGTTERGLKLTNDTTEILTLTYDAQILTVGCDYRSRNFKTTEKGLKG